jgi:hypothetical protein
MSNGSQDGGTDTALKRYDIVMSHLRFEHNQFWTRFGFMMVSETALLGFLVLLLINAVPGPKLGPLVFAVPISVMAITLLLHFRRLHDITAYWIQHYLEIIDNLEPQAFGELEVGRHRVRAKAPGHLRDVALRITWLLLLIWVIVSSGVLIGIGWAIARLVS